MATQAWSTLQSSMLASTAFASLTRPHLLRTVYLSFGNITRGGQPRTLASLADYLQDRSHAAFYVQNLTLCNDQSYPSSPQKYSLEELCIVLKLFYRLENLGLCNVRLNVELPA